jgi:putative heme-binding domain-containing protein
MPHLAVRALLALNATDACVAAIGTENSKLALWALRYMHNEKAVNGLIAAYNRPGNANLKKEILTTLSRLYREEAPYDTSWWWGTRPDAPGPYYKAITWTSSPTIEAFLKGVWDKADTDGKAYITYLNTRNRMAIDAFGVEDKALAADGPKVDLEKVKSQKGQVGKSSIEDVMLAIAKIEGDPAVGKALFSRQGCINCHTLDKSEKPKGPFMGQIGSIMNREQIAESILKPSASISQGFATNVITAKGGKNYMGFVTAESADRLVMRDLTGTVFTVKTSDILTRKELETSMMPVGLANALSYEEMASLVNFLSKQKK